jgi:hypothetical protein
MLTGNPTFPVVWRPAGVLSERCLELLARREAPPPAQMAFFPLTAPPRRPRRPRAACACGSVHPKGRESRSQLEAEARLAAAMA